jgi:chromosomal replication initiation ATPase DnaA
MINNNKLLNIILVVCGVSKEQFYSDKRGRNIVLARHLFSYISRFKLGNKLVPIAQFIGRNHTTVIHGITTISNLLSVNDQEVQTLYLSIIDSISKEYELPIRLDITARNRQEADEIKAYIEEKYKCAVLLLNC